MELPPSARLGKVHLCDVGQGSVLASLVAHHRIGPSEQPRLKYAALQNCFSSIADAAGKQNASVHLPRLGASAGGDWGRIEQMILESIALRGFPVTVYDLPPKRAGKEAELFG